jgi:hypothetical protein
MSINASGTNYMSNASILEWMELKTERLYAQMRDSMGESNTRVDAEDALNDIKARMADLKASGADASPLRDQINETIKKYGAEFPEVGQVLQPIEDELSTRIEEAQLHQQQPNPTRQPQPTDRTSSTSSPPAGAGGETVGKHTEALPDKVELPHVKISSEDAERWTNQITEKVDTLGKQDQLGMVHLQDINAQLNRAKDIASALMASADKASDNIVAHIG